MQLTQEFIPIQIKSIRLAFSPKDEFLRFAQELEVRATQLERLSSKMQRQQASPSDSNIERVMFQTMKEIDKILEVAAPYAGQSHAF